ncbi:Amino acid permease [Granulicella sibirica]|uniref:Amino acid permease n=1 Tax=Granulicella sibirica TaxID=2479048 RepID=A0A4V1L4X0_9BACT|nr:Amino acid permease [Granulicella sibirica]
MGGRRGTLSPTTPGCPPDTLGEIDYEGRLSNSGPRKSGRREIIVWRVKSLDAVSEVDERKSLRRSLGPLQLTLLGIGSTIGTGIFVLTAEAAQQAGPGMLVSFILAAFVCGIATLCYAEMSAMAPVSGAAYAYAYVSFGEFWAWAVGWALVLEYAITGSAVAVGWSGYFVGLLKSSVFHIVVPPSLANGPYAGGVINLPAVIISILVTLLLVRGTKESARVNALFVAVKVVVLAIFIALSLPLLHASNFHPFAPLGVSGIASASASIFFTFVGFDAVATAAEETREPQRNIPLGLFGALSVVTIIYVLVAIGVTGAYGSQPLFGPHGEYLSPGSLGLGKACESITASGTSGPLVCSQEALAFVLRQIGYPLFANLLGLVAFLALPSVILMMIYGQTRVFFVMSRDGLLPRALSRVHPRWQTPHIMTLGTGTAVTVAAAFLPVGRLAAIANSGTLFAFFMVSLAVLRLRRTDPQRVRPFRVAVVWIIAPLSAAGCVLLFLFLSTEAKLVLPVWSAIGLLIYISYGVRKSRMARRPEAR